MIDLDVVRKVCSVIDGRECFNNDKAYLRQFGIRCVTGLRDTINDSPDIRNTEYDNQQRAIGHVGINDSAMQDFIIEKDGIQFCIFVFCGLWSVGDDILYKGRLLSLKDVEEPEKETRTPKKFFLIILATSVLQGIERHFAGHRFHDEDAVRGFISEMAHAENVNYPDWQESMTVKEVTDEASPSPETYRQGATAVFDDHDGSGECLDIVLLDDRGRRY